MKSELFEELTQSVREGGEILRGETDAAREFTFSSPFDISRGLSDENAQRRSARRNRTRRAPASQAR